MKRTTTVRYDCARRITVGLYPTGGSGTRTRREGDWEVIRTICKAMTAAVVHGYNRQ